MRALVFCFCHVAALLLWPRLAGGQVVLPTGPSYVSAQKSAGSFPLVAGGQAAHLYASESDWPGVLRTIRDVQADLNRVTGREAIFTTDPPALGHEPAVLIGTVGHSPLIDKLVQSGKLDVSGLAGRWETFVVQALDNPLPGVARALVVAGSDKRGTIYGLYDLSAQMGVSPWYWWADVPVPPQQNLYVAAGRHTQGEPVVKYRGLFLGDESPALAGWAKEKFGGLNAKMYAQVFELILRLKGNCLWPATGGNAFADDDPANPELADTYGIVLGTAPQEPMLRAQPAAGRGPWNYQTNAPALQDYWRQGIRRMGRHESIVTLGLPGSPPALLEKVVADQRHLLAEETHRPAEQTPQLWAPEQAGPNDYNQGRRLPDDVTLLLTDDNWGNLRQLPRLADQPRRGGYGIYYHFAYVGEPRSYQWLNTSPLPRIWEQLHLAHAYGANQIWLVNVGALKPLELPISFFLDYAWNPAAIGPADVAAYTQRWAGQQFGAQHAADIADILTKYTKYNSRRKPELLDARTYSLATGEWAAVVADYNQLVARAERIGHDLPAAAQNAYAELVLHPVQASANLNELYYTVALTHEAQKRNQVTPTQLAAKAEKLFAKDSVLTQRYHALAAGKWNHLLDRPHLGYTGWQPPTSNSLPEAATNRTDSPTILIDSVKANVQVTYVAIEAEHYTQAVAAAPITWQRLPDLGRTLGAMTTFPVTAAATTAPGGHSPHLEYRFTLTQPGPVTVSAYLAPTLDFTNTTGLRYAVSIDDETPQIVNLHTGLQPDISNQPWRQAVAAKSILKTSQHQVATAGAHVLKFWRVDPGVVLEKLVVSQGALPASYLGPPENGPGKGPRPAATSH
ncbi:MAG: glycosyl hydrolase 115 family protein [Janthinobacterium lividum]